MSDDTVQDTVPAAAPVDQAPAPAIDPATVAAIAQAVAAALAPPPAPAPVTPTTVPAPTPAAAPAALPVEAGELVVHSYDHFGRTQHQVMLVVDVYQATLTDPQTHQVTGTQTRLRMLPLTSTHELADLPADAQQLQAADAFDWEASA